MTSIAKTSSEYTPSFSENPSIKELAAKLANYSSTAPITLKERIANLVKEIFKGNFKNAWVSRSQVVQDLNKHFREIKDNYTSTEDSAILIESLGNIKNVLNRLKSPLLTGQTKTDLYSLQRIVDRFEKRPLINKSDSETNSGAKVTDPDALD